MFKKILIFACLISAIDAYAATSSQCNGEEGYYFTNDRKTNPRKGGFVANGAFVSEDAFVAPTAAICDSATIENNVRVMGKAVVKGEAYISGYVRIMGNAIVGGTAEISGRSSAPTVIKGYARIYSGAITSGRHGSNSRPQNEVDAENQAKALTANKKKQEEAFDNAYRAVRKNIDNSDFSHYEKDYGTCNGERLNYKADRIQCSASAKRVKDNSCQIEIESQCKYYGSDFFRRCDGDYRPPWTKFFRSKEVINFPATAKLVNSKKDLKGRNVSIDGNVIVRFETKSKAKELIESVNTLSKLCD